MFGYFTGFLKGYTAVTETTLSAWLLLQKIVAHYPFLSIGVQTSFEELFGKIEKLEETFSRIEDPELRKDFQVAVKKNIAADFAALLDAHRVWWHAFYPKSFVSIPDPKLESFYR